MMRKQWILLIVLVFAIFSLVKIIEFFRVNVVEGDATQFVLEDLHSKYPEADIEIITIKETENEDGEKYFEIKAKVTDNPESACPERMHIFYHYPVQNFVTRPPEVITSGCEVCEEPECILVFPEEAVIASHTFEGTAAVHHYISIYPDAAYDVVETAEGWRVIWNSEDADFYYIVDIMKNNSVEPVEKVSKTE